MQGGDAGSIASIIIDFVVVVQDWALDIITVYLFAVAQHYKWTAAAIFFMYLPGITLFVAKHFDNFKPVDSRCRRHLIDFGTLLAYPVIIIYMGVNEICGGTGASMKYFKQLKCYDGLLESSFMFMMQLIVLFQQTPIGDFDVLGVGLVVIPNGKFWVMLTGLLSSLIGFTYNICEYHVLCDDSETDIPRQLKLMPYYSVHFIFRSFTFAMFFIYWREASIAIFVGLWLLNTFLTWRTYVTDIQNMSNHIYFCTIVGGFCSMLTPCFAVFFKDTTTGRNVNYFYKRNILFTNGIFALIFATLIAHLNLDPYQGFHELDANSTVVLGVDQFKADSFNYVRRNVLFSCKDKKHSWTNHEFSLPPSYNVSSEDLHAAPFLGSNVSDGCTWWWTRTAKGASDDERIFFRTQAGLSMMDKQCGGNMTKNEFKHVDHYLVSQPCHANETEVTRFNMYVIPTVAISGVISTCLAFHKFEMFMAV